MFGNWVEMSKDTKLFFSISSKPGSFGATFFNFAFDYYNIDAIYKPLGIGNHFRDYGDFVAAMYYVGATGFSVSMPFKKCAAGYCTDKHVTVKETGNANTIILDKFLNLRAYNCDCYGFERSCEPILRRAKKAMIYGTGAYSDSICYVLKKSGIPYARISRQEGGLLKYNDGSFDFLINASPVGMTNVEDSIFSNEIVDMYKYVFDCVVSKEATKLINISSVLGKRFVTGKQASFENACKQLGIYLYDQIDSRFIPKETFKKRMMELGY